MSVLAFPTDTARARAALDRYAGNFQPGVILILPVVRIDRDDGSPAPHRQRRLLGKTADECHVDDMVTDGKE